MRHLRVTISWLKHGLKDPEKSIQKEVYKDVGALPEVCSPSKQKHIQSFLLVSVCRTGVNIFTEILYFIDFGGKKGKVWSH